ncbi:hypothetical protein ACMFMG_004805 [Clarireedia jacksonii]
MTFNAMLAEAENLLKTEYHSTPSPLIEYINFVTPTIHFDKRLGTVHKHQHHGLSSSSEALNKRNVTPHGSIGIPDDVSYPKQGAQVTKALMSLEDCNTIITTHCLQALCNFPPRSKAAFNNTLGIVEYTSQAFFQTDLDMWFKQLQPGQQDVAPNVKSVDGAEV